MFALLKQIDPPLGFGSKCPDLLSYKRLVRMNMPIDDEGRVNFTTTLFALVRVNLQGGPTSNYHSEQLNFNGCM